MNTEEQQAKREYESPLRANQASQTRARILDAFAEQMVDGGLKDFSIERVARRAGVSTRTVYHHFPNRDELLDAVSAWLESQVSEDIKGAADSEEFLRRLGLAFESFDEHETLVRAQLITELGRSVRAAGRSQRRPTIEALVRSTAPKLAPAEVHRISSLIHYLGSSEAWRSLKDESGLSGSEAGQAVSWAIQTLLTEAKKSQSGSSKQQKGNRNDER